MMRYEIRDDSGFIETIEADSMDEAKEVAEEQCQDGGWGDEGASVCVWISDEEGQEHYMTVEIPPNHDALISAAADRNMDIICGTDPDDHEWTAEGEGGCDENPGVWSTGGTSMTFSTHCRVCGLHRTEIHLGSQRNHGEHDTVEYRILDEEEIEIQRKNGTMNEVA